MSFSKTRMVKKLLPGTILIILFSFAPAYSHAQSLKNFDRSTVEEFSEDRSAGMTKSMQAVSNTTNYLSLGIPAAIIIKGFLSHDQTTLKKGLYITESIGISTGITIITKYLVNRQRPFATDSLVIKASDGGGPSFPSGHTSEAFATATSLSIAFPKWYVVIPSFAWAGTVGLSRMYLGVHYPTDVFVGALVGSGSAFLSYKLNKWMQSQKKKKQLTTFIN